MAVGLPILNGESAYYVRQTCERNQENWSAERLRQERHRMRREAVETLLKNNT